MFLALGLILIPMAPSIPILAIVIVLVPLGTAFTFPCVTAMLSRVISQDERGLFMGTQQTFGGITRVIFPLGAGLLYDHVQSRRAVLGGCHPGDRDPVARHEHGSLHEAEGHRSGGRAADARHGRSSIRDTGRHRRPEQRVARAYLLAATFTGAGLPIASSASGLRYFPPTASVPSHCRA